MTKVLLIILLKLIPLISAGTVSRDSLVFERIITNYTDVLNGVPIDFRYNETSSTATSTSTSSKSQGFKSAPGCPKSEVGIPWVYYGTKPWNRKCFLAGEKGPCDTNEKLFLEVGNPVGVCNCECFIDSDIVSVPVFEWGKMRFCRGQGGREFVYMPEKRKCFAVYDQGPCEKNEWLAKTQDKKKSNSTDSASVQCETRKCPSGQVPYGSPKDDKSFVEKDDCFSPISAYSSPVSIIPNDCDSGMKYSGLLKKCVKSGRSGGSLIG